ncbi:molybdopterin molybdotransferase MoeA [Pseudoxanthomonas dokdonensis]|uniref:Molybdopterin molybdenumtransferase n=1 Tax=Pseudoxanthomonas dokdonensis TaxID=344882 RepID=A0A0R0CZG6_9GAMM|nr:molybdopterin molybdotransferase MoeA [Pseudoxanthomonas dokdonensis]KRG71527.1 hypothetical protein ABB29_01775 [Pseudoxanthomonas dokdonensis]
MIDYPQALTQLLAAATLLDERTCATGDGLGQLLATSIRASESLPPFDAAAMDGYALPAGDFDAGSEWPVEAAQYAGHGRRPASAGAAWEITTGARMPDGLVSVVPVEQVQTLAASDHGAGSGSARICLLQPVVQGQHMRSAGSDIRAGQLLLQSGTRLGPEQLMVLHAMGIGQLRVRAAPRCAVICTGGELVSSPCQALDSGQIRDSNRGYLQASLRAAGAECVHASTVADDPRQWRQHLDTALAAGAQLVISTGAVSMGALDFIPAALREAGAGILFHKVAIRPGKPLLLARLADGTLYLGLSGNPAACAVGMRFFVLPLLRAMQGQSQEQPWLLPLAHDVDLREGPCHFLSARIEANADAGLAVRLLAEQASSRLLPLVQANAWVMLAAGGRLRAGQPVPVFGHGMAGEQGMQALPACAD